MADDVAGVNEDLKGESRTYGNWLRLRLRHWTPVDEAMWHVGVLFGLWPDEEGFAAFRNARGAFWSRNAVGTSLSDTLNLLVRANLLERRETSDYEYRWKSR